MFRATYEELRTKKLGKLSVNRVIIKNKISLNCLKKLQNQYQQKHSSHLQICTLTKKFEAHKKIEHEKGGALFCQRKKTQKEANISSKSK